MKRSLVLTADSITKRFSSAPIFMPVSFEARSGEIVAITGSNGSGKSTLLKILAHLLTPSKGKTEYHIDGKAIEYEELQRVGGFAAPYMELYAELTATEHLKFIAELKKKPLSDSESVELLVSLGLNREIASSTRYVKQYSSGMQQRVKLAMAFALESEFIFLDEPSSNLDTAGIDRLFEHIRASSERGAIVVIATNDPAETSLATKTVAVEAYKKASA